MKTFYLLVTLCACISFNTRAQLTAIPDPNFEQELINQGYDTGVPDGTVPTANISGVVGLLIYNVGITDFTGIEDFASLSNLSIVGNSYASLDLSMNSNLTNLSVLNNNQLVAINLNNLTNLSDLYIENCPISSAGLGINNCPNLITLNLIGTDITILDLSASTNLLILYLEGNSQLSLVDLTNITYMLTLHITNNPMLTDLYLPLDGSQFVVMHNPISSPINVSGMNISHAVFIDAEISIFEANNCPQLFQISVNDNKLTSLSLSGDPSLSEIKCNNNELTNINIANSSVSGSINCSNNQLSDLTLNIPNLPTLDCSHNDLHHLDVTGCSSLQNLYCNHNNLENIDVNNNAALKKLHCYDNRLSALVLNSNPALTELRCENNFLEWLVLQNGQNPGINVFDATNNPHLYCVTVDDPVYSTNNWPNIDPQAVYTNSAACNFAITQVENQYCGGMIPSYTSPFHCTAAGFATDYKYKFTELGTANVTHYVRGAASTDIELGWVAPALAFNTQYEVQVQAFSGGTWWPYGPSCIILTPPTAAGIPLTQLNFTCGNTVSAFDVNLSCSLVTNAVNYEFEFTDPSLNVLAYQSVSGTFQLQDINGIEPSTQYDVRVRSFMNNVWSNWGPVCSIMTPVVPSTQLIPFNCNIQMSNYTSHNFYCTAVPGANNYAFWFSSTVDGSDHYASNFSTSTAYVLDDVFPQLALGTTYEVRARAQIGTTWGNWGWMCELTTPAVYSMPVQGGIAQSDGTDQNNLQAETFPNPSDGVFVNLKFENIDPELPVHLTVYDLQGRQIFNTEVSAQTSSYIQEILFETPLVRGIYLLNIRNGASDVNRRFYVN